MSFNESAGVRAQLQSQVAVRNHIEGGSKRDSKHLPQPVISCSKLALCPYGITANVSWLFPEEVQKRCIHVFTYVSKYEDSIVYHAIACANPRYMVVREGQPMTEADTGEKNLRIFFNTNLYPPYATTRGEALESLLEMTEESIASHLELQKYTDLEERRAEAIVKRDWSKMLTNALAPAVERHAEIDDRICSEVRDSLLRELSGHKSVSADIGESWVNLLELGGDQGSLTRRWAEETSHAVPGTSGTS